MKTQTGPERDPHACMTDCERTAVRPRAFRKPMLSAELLAATLAACAQNLAATRRRLAGEETVTAGANQIARLKSPLHEKYPYLNCLTDAASNAD